MARGPFDPDFGDLPVTLPIFPLPGVLLLPRGKLPLNIFEPRYLSMTQDALQSDRLIGMVQPRNADETGESPPVFPVGCAGRITSFSETDDGRYLITLSGLCRFRIERELPLISGYRRVVPDFKSYRADLDAATAPIERNRLIAALRGYLKQQSISADWDSIDGAPDERLVTTLSMICPFSTSEKQALLEAPCLGERAKVLITLLEMATLAEAPEDAQRH